MTAHLRCDITYLKADFLERTMKDTFIGSHSLTACT